MDELAKRYTSGLRMLSEIIGLDRAYGVMVSALMNDDMYTLHQKIRILKNVRRYWKWDMNVEIHHTAFWELWKTKAKLYNGLMESLEKRGQRETASAVRKLDILSERLRIVERNLTIAQFQVNNM